MKEFFIDFLDQ